MVNEKRKKTYAIISCRIRVYLNYKYFVISSNMKPFVRLIFLCTLILTVYNCFAKEDYNKKTKWPTVAISVLVRNKAHTLPYFLSCLYKLDYPKERIYIWIYADYNQDESVEIVEKWADKYSHEYNGIDLFSTNATGSHFRDEKSSTHWSLERFKHVINLREKALKYARRKWCDFLFMIDADVFLTNEKALKVLVGYKYVIVAPMLISDGLYSNFWCGMSDTYYYQRTEDYKPILERVDTGCFDVPMVHTAVLISLTYEVSDNLTYDPKIIDGYDGPQDDIIAFAVNAKKNKIPMAICNDHVYGFVTLPLEEDDDLSKDSEQLLNVKMQALSRGTALPLDNIFDDFISYPEPWKFGCSEIYMINLERRKERRELMELSFRELGMDATVFRGFDGKDLDFDDLSKYSITLMPGYEDPYHKRPMKAGEVGCFMSHYYIWREVVEKKLEITLVLEDDIHFVPYFRSKFMRLLDELKSFDWDLVYIGRKILLDGEEHYVTDHITKPLYSYWTLGYLISERGAKKLLNANPLTKMLPVDEFLPIMFNQHPNETWKSYFPKRNLVAFSAAPLLVNPTHYTGQEGYISDTEDSIIIDFKSRPMNFKVEL